MPVPSPGLPADADLDVRVRAARAAALRAELERAVEGSRVVTRGSAADELSDIDLAWRVPDTAFVRAVEVAPRALAAVGPVALLRVDPDLRLSARRRLLFATYADLPLFWRVDLDVRAAATADVDRLDEDDPAPPDASWSLPASALMNAVAAEKARRRGREADARALLERGAARIQVPSAVALPLPDAIGALARACARKEPALAPLAERAVALASAPPVGSPVRGDARRPAAP